MEYQFSSIVDPSTYATAGLCDVVPLRVHQTQETEDVGAIAAQWDWRKHVSPTVSKRYRGSLGPEYNFLSVAFPETIPERMKLLAYFDEFIFLHDDVVEAVDQKEVSPVVRLLRLAYKADNDVSRDTGRHLMVSKVSQQMLAIDPVPATETLALWVEWFDKGAGRRNHTRFDSLEEYLEYRILDVGKMYLTGVAIFAMGLRIPPHEHELRSQLCRPAWVALGLTNDLYSIDKEREAAKTMGEDHVCNAVWVAQQEYGLGEDEAKELCREKTKDCVVQYLQTVEEVSRRTDVSRDLKIFVEAVQYILSGNVVWTLGAPRYHPEKTHNPRQLERMANGVPEATGVERLGIVGLVGAFSRVFQIAVQGLVSTLQGVFRSISTPSKAHAPF
ncbi:isoprenoid synthase domain-containing protein [Cercophora newfieldiana]|uniref:Isoprenoid synthase domain-containing protein n=1 Tax=Cercophora newfieldiana TaxID=92897 RepID=A0AA40CJG3_9PEZI|nr:isoprenoid synthase domain-containing protein [Cercophora newfieldiana]